MVKRRHYRAAKREISTGRDCESLCFGKKIRTARVVFVVVTILDVFVKGVLLGVLLAKRNNNAL